MLRSLILPLLALVSGCVPFGVSGKVGYTRMKVGGELALTSGVGSQEAIEQSVDSAFGLGGGQGSPYLQGEVDFGAPVVKASVFWLSESGQGELADSFGGLVQGTTVDSTLDLAVAKISATYDFDLGLVKVSPGVMFDVFALDFRASEQALMSSEEIDDIAVVPMAFVRGEAGFGPVQAIAELGYLEYSGVDGNDGRFLDVEAMIEWYPLPLGHVFAGYRYININGEGDSESREFATDLQIAGWIVGGGIRF